MATNTVERGDIYFFYRPKIDIEQPKGFDDVQRLYMALLPDEGSQCRLFFVGKKRMPAIVPGESDSSEREWIMIDLVAAPEEVGEALQPISYQTKTRGEREQGEAIPVGEGRYGIFERDGATQLAYRLANPEKPGKAQKELGIQREASYVISVRNPKLDVPGFPDEKPDYPQSLMKKFADERWLDVSDPKLLDYERAQCVLIGAHERLEDTDMEITGNPDLFRRLKLEKSAWPTEALTEGRMTGPSYGAETRTPRRDPSKGGERGGSAALDAPSAAGIARALKGVDFPRDRSELVDYAEAHDAGDRIIGVLKELPANKFNTMTDVQRALAEVR